MIAHLSGTLREKQATSVILDVGGVGYEVTIPVTTFFNMEEPGAQVQLRVYTHVREDTLQLFGFRTARERELFRLLISVSGVGPQSAIGILSMSVDELISAIRGNNLARLTSIPKVGRKIAERLVLELRDKVSSLASPALDAELDAGAGGAAALSEDALREDTLSALVNLGYQKALAEKAITQAAQEGGDLSVELLLRRSLRHLSKG